MADRRDQFWKNYSDVYSPSEIRAVLNSLGVRVASESENDFICFCPFHGNSHTPSMTVSRLTGVFNCFNPSCASAGNLKYMVRRITSKNEYETLRYLSQYRTGAPDYEAMIRELQKEEVPKELVEFPQARVDEMHEALMKCPQGAHYLINRGFTRSTIEKFECGYGLRKDPTTGKMLEIVSVPVHDENGLSVGYVGRSIVGKEFKNSPKLPRNQVVFNAHRAKKAGGTAIVTEASFDTMLLDQRGFPAGVAILGGVLSASQVRVLDRYFDRIIIATDFDEKQVWKNCAKCKKLGYDSCKGHNPGRDLGVKIADALRGKEILWACTDTFNVYPDGKKDIGELSDQETIMVINNAIPHYEYLMLGLY